MKLFLVDGHALVFKMYYAFLGRPMINSKGVDTSILFGFTKYLLEMINREQPSHIAVCFDPPGGTFRNEMYPEYKANRTETPQLVIDALEPLSSIVRAMGIPVVMVKGFEADDVIGTMAKRFAGNGMTVYMVTPDKDYGQLTSDDILQYKPGKSGSDNEVLGPREVCSKWGISDASQVIDILTICGDASDNVPGVAGVGPVGASKLLLKYGSLDAIYEHLDELTPRQADLFRSASDHIALSRNLVTIRTDVPVDVRIEDMHLGSIGGAEISRLFNEYEFNSLRKYLSWTSDDVVDTCEPEARMIFEPASLDDIASSDEIAFALKDGELFIASKGKVTQGSLAQAGHILQNAASVKFCYGLKEQIKVLQANGISIEGKVYDVELMHYVLDPEQSHHLESLVVRGNDDLFTDSSKLGSEEVSAIFETGLKLLPKLKSAGLLKLYEEIEAPLVGVLARMEIAGVKIDLSSLDDFAEDLRKEMLHYEAKVREIAENPQLNVASPKQIGEVIFEKLKLDPKAKKPSKGNWPTDEETISALADRSPIIDYILEYRAARKLLSTYIEPFGQYVSKLDGRVHTTFNQALTATGRLSSSNPNLQNIPVRTEQGKKIRAAFVPEDSGSVMMSADYSQIELRIMAHLSCDSHLVNAFNDGLDVHSATASKIFGVPVKEVTSDQRRVAKTANFGIMYGISSFGLAQRLKCSRSEAKQIIDDYFASFPAIRSYISDALVAARENGYVETIFGRRRYLPEINSHNANIRAFAERNAVNAPIQGSAADIIKLAMNSVDRKISEAGLQSRMVLQIHDELLLEVPFNEIEAARQIVVSEMENVVKLSIPLSVECNYGKTWLEAH